MNCREFENLAGEVFEGEPHPEAYAHLASCPACRFLLDELGAIERAARTLPVCEPSAQFWRRLEAAAADENLLAHSAGWEWLGLSGHFFPSRVAFAGALAVVLLVAAGVLSYPTLDLPVAYTTPADLFQVAQGELIQEADYTSRYEIHLQQIEDGVLNTSSARESDVRGLAARSLVDVDRAITETQAQLNDYPDDALARDELLRLYRQKATVLQAISDPLRYDDAR